MNPSILAGTSAAHTATPIQVSSSLRSGSPHLGAAIGKRRGLLTRVDAPMAAAGVRVPRRPTFTEDAR